MRDGIVFWAAVAFCASFYFDWTARGLQLAGQFEAARANHATLLAIVIPSAVLFFRDVLRMLRR